LFEKHTLANLIFIFKHRCEFVVRFVDIGGIVDRYCLTFHFIVKYNVINWWIKNIVQPIIFMYIIFLLNERFLEFIYIVQLTYKWLHFKSQTSWEIDMTLMCYSCVLFWIRVMVFNATFNDISVISWRSVLLAEKTGVHGENHRLVWLQVYTNKKSLKIPKG